MSVLKNKRTQSKAEYVNTANQIYIKTVDFLSRLSARYSRLLAVQITELAGSLMDNMEEANSIYPSNPTRKDLRLRHLLEGRAALHALDVRLTHCYWIMYQNPQGCFTAEHGGTVPSSTAMRRLDNMAQELGELIDQEDKLIGGVLESDRLRK